ncbi:MAG: hypothetical protein GXO57_07470 [Thermodesulfobacteria bacterium]|nr:hypothetical protein [Thermodesulfobacteriota bacterium]
MFLAFDCEGPLTLNDNAFEYCKYKIPNGDKFFTKISRFDDYLADIKRRPNYKAGDTLKLILPFLKLFGANNQELKEFSKKTLLFLKDVPDVLSELAKKYKVFIISTSYKPYLEALCEVTGFPMENVFCTEVDLDGVELSEKEKQKLEELFKEIMELPEFELPSTAKTPEDLDASLLEVLNRLEEIFFEVVWNMEIGRFLKEVNPVGGKEKARSCKLISEKLGEPLSEATYIGDSITDTDAFKLVKEGGGITISFNGNRYALREAEYYCLSNSGKFYADLVEKYLEKLKDALTFPVITETYEFGKIPVEEEEFKKVVEKSEAYRKRVRGEAIGALG